MVSVRPALILGRSDHDAGVFWSGVGLDGDHRLGEVDGEASLFQGVSCVFGDTYLHSVNLITEVVDLELEVLVGLGHQLNERLDGLNLNDAKLHDVDEGVDLGRSGVGGWQVVQFLNLSGDRQLSGLHLHVGVGANHNLEVDFLASADVHVTRCGGCKTIAGHLNGDLFDVGRWVGNSTGGVAGKRGTWLDFDLNLTGCARH